jgi:uncharacterized protein
VDAPVVFFGLTRAEFVVGFMSFILRWRWLLLPLILFCVMATGSGGSKMVVDDDARRMFGKDNRHLQAFDALEAEYTKIEGVMFVLAPKDRNVFTTSALGAIEELTEASWQIPFANRVDSLTNYQHTRAEGDDLIVESLVEGAALFGQADLDRVKTIALSEPSLVNKLISETGHVTGVNVNVIKPGNGPTDTAEIVAHARGIAEDFRMNHPDIELYLTGFTMLDAAFGESAVRDIQSFFPAMILIVFLLTGIILRTFWGVLATIVITATSVITAMGAAGHLGIDLTAPMANAPKIIITLAVADCIHIVSTVLREMRAGATKNDAIRESLRINFVAVLVTSITTAIGFLTMNFADAPPFHDLGNIVAIGVMAAFVYSVVLLPILLSIFPMRPKASSVRKTTLSTALGDFVVKNRTLSFFGTAAIAVALFAAVPLNELDDDFITYFSDDFEVRRATDFAEDNLTGFQSIEFSIGAGAVGAVNEPSYLKKLDEFASWLRTQEGVVHVSSITDTYKRINRNMHGDDPAYYKLPNERELAAQYLLLYELSLPFGLDVYNQVNIDKSATRISVSSAGWTAKDLRRTEAAARTWLQKNAPEHMYAFGVSMSMMSAFMSQTNIEGMLGGMIIALALVSVILIVVFRSIKLGLISLIPNLAPVFMAFGAWGLLSGQVGVGIAVVGAMAFGIVVDDTVHFLSKYLRARREDGANAQEAVRYAFRTVGPALFTTSVVFTVGFLVTAMSGFRLNSDLGLMTALAISAALILDFFLLPPILMFVDGGKRR